MKKFLMILSVFVITLSGCMMNQAEDVVDKSVIENEAGNSEEISEEITDGEVENGEFTNQKSAENEEISEPADEEYVIIADLSDYVHVYKFDDSVGVCFYITHDKPYEVSKQMKKANRHARMDGYNWEVFLNYYLEKNAPELLEGFITDPEAGMYSAGYELTPENESKAIKFGEIIYNLIENEEEIYRIVREEGDDIEWDRGTIVSFILG